MSNKHKFRWIIITCIAVLAVALGVFSFVRWGKPEPGQAEFKAYKADYKAGNLRSAIEHCRLAADQGNLKAQTLLGLFYSLGTGVEQDYDAAQTWYRRAAKQGNHIAQRRLGDCYAEGHGVERDLNEAAKWYRLAAEYGDDKAAAALERLEAQRSESQ